jgi:hypothetical protein
VSVKPRRPLSSRKPPEPSQSHADIEERFGHVIPDLRPILERLDELIREAIPTPRYAVKWKNVFYGSPDVGWVIEVAAYDVSVNVVFFGGADFDPPPPLGNTDRSRYAKVTSLEEVGSLEVRGWIDQAAHVRGWMWDDGPP